MNKLGLFGLIGFLGILGLVTENKGFIAFFAYFEFVRYFFVKPDELFILNVRRAATPAFFTIIGLQAVMIAFSGLIKDKSFLLAGLAISFAVALAEFIIILSVLEYKEMRKR